MKIRFFHKNDSVQNLFSLISIWFEEAESEWKKLGDGPDSKKMAAGLSSFCNKDDKCLIILTTDSNVIVGFIGIEISEPLYTTKKLAVESGWYVHPKYRGMNSIKMLLYAEAWAKNKGCSHVIYNASMLSGNMHDKVAKLYKRLGASLLSTSYIKGV